METHHHDAMRHTSLRQLGADDRTVDEYLSHSCGTGWWPRDAAVPTGPPAEEEPQIADWEAYARSAAEIGVWETLRHRLVQLRFPIRRGIASDAVYRDATLRGRRPADGEGLVLECPDRLELRLHPSLAGRVPVIITASRLDFETLVRALTARNEPVPVPASMGACLVNGLNNWDRIDTLRRRWEETPAAEREGATWAEAFRAIIPRTELYKDRIILLSRGPYSGVSAEELRVPDDEWLRQSLEIRLEHECIHALTLRVFGALRHDLLEELVADWAALIRVRGVYDPGLALRFLGLEDSTAFRPGGRLEIYRGTPPMSDAAFQLMQDLARRVVTVLGRMVPEEESGPGFEDLLATRVIGLLTASAEELLPS
jgi:hypothetical protein